MIQEKETQKHERKLEKIAKAYSSSSWWYDIRGFFILTFAYRSTLPAQIRFFSKNIGKNHLEAAIGTGTLFEMVLWWKKLTRQPMDSITGFDYAPKMLEGAKWRFRNWPQVKLELSDITFLHYKDGSFDTINIANAIHCLPDTEKGLKELHRVLISGGTLAGNVLLYPKGWGPLDRIAEKINIWGAKKGILHRPYKVNEIKKMLLDLEFEFISEKISGNCYDFIVRKK